VPLSTVNDTLPVGVPAVELTVTVTLPFVGYITAGALIVVVVAACFTVSDLLTFGFGLGALKLLSPG
jgi:hypothetical protein